VADAAGVAGAAGAVDATGGTGGGAWQAPAGDGTVPIEFHGKWEEYFKIWIVNVLLTVATLGIYAAWAKVRTRRYFYGNTRLFGHAFEYLANPKRILLGNLIVAAMFFTYLFSGLFSPMMRLALLLVFALLIPWLVVRGLIFNARNTAWRGLRFRFGGRTGEAFKLFVLWPILIGLSLGLLLPYVAKRKKEFYINNHAYGKTGFGVNVDAGVFYKLYLKTLVFFVPLIIGYAGFLGTIIWMAANNPKVPVAAQTAGTPLGLMVFFVLLLYAGLLLAWVGANFLKARLFTYLWNNTRLGEHRFKARMRARDLLLVKFVNALVTWFTLGLLYPFAAVRLRAFQLSCLRVEQRGDLDAFVTASQPDLGALGDSATDFWDFDIGFGI
jgi:uncharacterized membrane protein YjgN (DUF898 family)